MRVTIGAAVVLLVAAFVVAVLVSVTAAGGGGSAPVVAVGKGRSSATPVGVSGSPGPSSLFVHVAEDPDAAWEQIAPYAVYDAVSYNTWQTGDHDNVAASDATTPEQLRASGAWEVVTPDQCVELARRFGSVPLHPLMGGMPTELGWQSLRLYVDEVLPRL